MDIRVIIEYEPDRFTGDGEAFIRDFPLSYSCLGFLLTIINQTSPVAITLSNLSNQKRAEAITAFHELLAGGYFKGIIYEVVNG